MAIVLPIPFGNLNINGLQHKGAIAINDKHYFAKLDDLRPNVNGEWTPEFNHQYSSISEAISSIFLKNVANKDQFDSVLYDWSTFVKNDQVTKTTGTVSENFLKENEVEWILAVDRNVDIPTLVNVNDYAENIIDVPAERRYKELVQLFTENGVDLHHAKRFLIQQAGFDLLTGNQDRLNNPGNFVLAQDITTNKARPINLDYGRCLPLMWFETTENNYNPTEWLKEDLDDFAANLTAKEDSILSGLRRNDQVNFLQTHDFEPFQLNKAQLHKDLDELKENIHQSNIPFPKFAEAKIESFRHSLDIDWITELYVDTSTPELEQSTSKEQELQIDI